MNAPFYIARHQAAPQRRRRAVDGPWSLNWPRIAALAFCGAFWTLFFKAFA